jgi:hypothetical protein
MGPTITINYYTGDGQLKWISHARNFVHFTAEGVVITEEDKGRVLLWCEIAKVQAAS